MSTAELKTTLANLDTASKMELIDFLWSDLYDEFEHRDVPLEHQQIVEERYAAFKSGKMASRSWQDAKNDLINHVRNRNS